MCGIVGYLGDKQAYPILIKGLQRLEYRGYDSAGVALADDTNIKLYKCKGKVADLEAAAEGNDIESTIGIGHTRWATHGAPNDVNAHPHISSSENLAIIHNGIIENYGSLKKALSNKGYTFKSDTDTEVLVNLIDDIQVNQKLPLAEAVRLALTEVVGAYAIAVLEKGNPNTIVAAKMGSPLVVGVGEDEFFLASDASPFLEFTRSAVYLEDGEIAILNRGEDLKIVTVENTKITPYIQELQMNLEAIEKGGYEHFMLKEIYEQPRSIYDTLRGRLLTDEGLIVMSGVEEYAQKMINAERFIFIACGTSWHAGLVLSLIHI